MRIFNCSSVWFCQGLALFNLKRFAEAKDSYLKGLELDGDNEVLKKGLRETEDAIRGTQLVKMVKITTNIKMNTLIYEAATIFAFNVSKRHYTIYFITMFYMFDTRCCFDGILANRLVFGKKDCAWPYYKELFWTTPPQRNEIWASFQKCSRGAAPRKSKVAEFDLKIWTNWHIALKTVYVLNSILGVKQWGWLRSKPLLCWIYKIIAPLYWSISRPLIIYLG